MDIITCVGKVQETEFVRSRSEPGRNCKNNKKIAINSMKSYNKPNKNYLVIKIIYVRRIL